VWSASTEPVEGVEPVRRRRQSDRPRWRRQGDMATGGGGSRGEAAGGSGGRSEAAGGGAGNESWISLR